MKFRYVIAALALLVSSPVLAAIDTVTQAPFIVDSETELTSVPCVAYTWVYAKDTNKNYVNLSSCPTVGTTPIWLQLTPTVVTAKSFSNSSRSLNTAFQISVTRDSAVSYGVDVSATLSLVTGQTGTVALQYADDSGFTTNVVTVNSAVNGNTGTLAIGLGLTQLTTVTVSGIIPAGKYVRLATANTTGTPTFTFRSAQEVQL